MPRYLLPTLAYDRAAILRAAWVEARRLVVVRAKRNYCFPAQPISLTDAFAEALRSVWDIAKLERGKAVREAERSANAAVEAARRAALTTHDRAIEDAELAVEIAEHTDTLTLANLAVMRAAHARLAMLRMSA